MIFEKTDKKTADIFFKTIHQRVRNVFSEESLKQVRGEGRDMRLGENNTNTDINSIANDRALLASFGNLQDQEESKFNKLVERERRQMCMETFDARYFQKMSQ